MYVVVMYEVKSNISEEFKICLLSLFFILVQKTQQE